MRRHLAILMIGALLCAMAVVSISSPAGASPPKKPSAPQSLTVVPVNTGIVVSWAAPATSGSDPITGYVETVAPRGTPCNSTGPTSCIALGLVNGKKYKVRVRAVSAAGNGKWAKVTHVIPTSAQNCGYVGEYGNLQGCNLSYQSLSGANLTGANLSGGNLQGIDLDGANLTGANLSGANLQQANLTDANLTDANLTDANLETATVTGADVSGANLSNDSDIDLDVTQSGGITGAPADLRTGWVVGGGYMAGPGTNLSFDDLAGADLDGVNLTGSNVGYADLSGASLVGAILDGNFDGVNLTGANLTGANLSGANLQQANLTDANLTDANLTDANLETATVTGADVSGANLSNDADSDLDVDEAGGITGTPAELAPDWTVTDGFLLGPSINPASPADLENAALANSDLTDANLGSDDLTNGVLTDANLSGTNFGGANLTGADLDGATNMSGDNVSSVTWSNTICPDGYNSDTVGITCVNDGG